MKEMGIDMEDFGTYEDPELAALDAELKKAEAGGNHWNDADLLEALNPKKPDPAIRQKELEDLIERETKRAVTANKAGNKEVALAHVRKKRDFEAQLKEHMTANPPKPKPVEVAKAVAQPDPVQQAPEMQELKQRRTTLMELKKEKSEAEDIVADDDDPLDLEEKYHSIDNFCSTMVIEHEIKYLELLCLKYKN